MKDQTVEHGLISVFRVYASVKLIFFAIAFLTQQFFTEPKYLRTQTNSLVGIAESLALIGFLSWPWLRNRLGKTYLPIALSITTLGTFAEYYAVLFLHVQDDYAPFRAMSNSWQNIIFLLVPLIILSWKYNYKTVVLYCLVILLFDPGIMIPFKYLNLNLSRLGPVLSVGILRTFLLLLVGYATNRLARELRIQNKELEMANQKLSSYADALEQLTISRERNHMARELHDTLAHTLSALSVQLEAVSALWDSDQNRAHAMLEQSLGITREGLHETRRAIQALRASPLDDLGLLLALDGLAHSIVERSSSLSLELDLPATISGLSPEEEQCIYRVAQEALHNAAQHSEANKVSLRLAQEDNHLILTIKDNGKGFNEARLPQKDHYGLRGMRERAEMIDALIEITSQVGEGTQIELVMEHST